MVTKLLVRSSSVLLPSLAAALTLVSAALPAQQKPSFAEQWALAPDRGALLATVLPGSSEWFWYRCRERLDAGDFATVDMALTEWRERHPSDGDRQTLIENRRMLLDASLDETTTFGYLQQRLGLRFDHTRADPSVPLDLPTSFDPALVEREALVQRAFAKKPGSFDAFDDSALPWLLERQWPDEQLLALLQRTAKGKRTDLPQVPALVVRHLATSGTPFSAGPIAEQLLLEQLDECLRLAPALLQDHGFVTAYVRRIAPEADVRLATDRAAREQHLIRLWNFAQRLGPTENDLKAHVLSLQLSLDLERGVVDEPRFLAWLALPRQSGVFVRTELRRDAATGTLVIGATPPTGLVPGFGDDDLVLACFEHLFATRDDTAPYAPYAPFVDAEWLQRTFATTKLLLGQGDPKQWQTVLGEDAARELERRVELRFAPTVPRTFAAKDRVVLDIDTKNVASLLVRVHPIDALRWYREKQIAIPLDLDLDGMVAAHERTIAIVEPPIRRVRHRLELPECDAPGTYVVESIGNGLRTRLLFHKGELHCVNRVAADGHRFRVHDEAGAPVPDATIRFGGRDFTAGPDGDIRLPFTDEPGQKQIVVSAGERATLATFDQVTGAPVFECGFHLDREQLIAGATARLLLRPWLAIAGVEVSPTRLRDVQVRIVATDIDGVVTTRIIRDVAFVDDREFVREFAVPDRLRTLQVLVGGRVWVDGGGAELVSDSFTLDVNSADDTIATFANLAMRTQDGLVLEQRGKNGESRDNRAIAVEVRVQGFHERTEATLRTDEAGRIRLGALRDLDRASFFVDGKWQSMGNRERHRFPPTLHALEGETLRIAYPADAPPPTRADVTFRSEHHDLFPQVALRDGFLELRDLPRGDHELRLHRFHATIEVRVTRGVRDGVWLVGARTLESGPIAEPLGLGAIEVRGRELLVPVRNPSPRTRVHVVATRYERPFSLASSMAIRRAPLEAFEREVVTSTIAESVPMPDEARYVLERRSQPRFPGNLLPRPSLLVNRLDLALTEDGGLYGSRGGSKPGGGKYGSRLGRGKGEGGAGGRVNESAGAATKNANLDWLPRPSVMLTNLVPGPDGVVRVPVADLGDGQHVQVVALDGDQLLSGSMVRTEAPLVPRPRQLQRAFDLQQDLVDLKRVVPLVADATVPLRDTAPNRVALIDSLARVRAMFTSIAPDAPSRWFAGSDEFGFLLDWPKLDDVGKRAAYSAHACHELHFFLWHEDRAFFDAVVRPAIGCKRVKTFVDHWLLGDDVQRFVEPLAYERLNVVERAMLGRRLGGAVADAIARDLQEAIRARPKDANETDRRFECALSVGALDTPAAPPDNTPRLKDEDIPPSRFVPLGETRRYIEHDWWRRRADQSGPMEVVANRFWIDWITAPADRPFVPASVLEVGDTLLERIMALAVLDLPFESASHEIRGDGEARTLRSASPLCLVQRTLAPGERPAAVDPLVLGQNFVRLDDRFVVVDGERRDRRISGEFVVGVPYACQVVLTNPTANQRAVRLLLQIPAGAIPIRKGFQTSSRIVTAAPWSTTSFEYAFYFPAPGDFVHWPVHASENGVPVASAEARPMHVVAAPTTTDPTSWDDVSQRGTNDEVLAWIDAHDAAQTDFERIAWRAKDPAFFATVVGKLRARFVIDDTLWSLGILHRDRATTREYLAHADPFLAQCGPVLASPLVTIDPFASRRHQHLELDPVVRARVHRVDPASEADQAIVRQYDELLELLSWQPRLSSEDWLAVTYYQLLLDRIADGLASLAKVDPARIAERFQFDYLAAYAAFFTRDVAKARALASPHRDFPVDHWRDRFREVLAQADEAEGKARPVVPETQPVTNAANPNDLAAQQAASLEAAVQGDDIVIRAQNVASCEVRYHVLAVELAFSTQPFAKRDAESAAFVLPALRETRSIPASGQLSFAMPAQFADRNTLVEIRAAGVVRTVTRFANALAARFVEPWGQVIVTDPANGAPLPEVYVKVFAREKDGDVRFHKDGYTDLRGRFDYVSVSDRAGTVANYAILVLDDRRGAVIREIEPPAK